MAQKLFAVAGVTGNTGSAAAATLLERGARVRALVRTEEKGRPWKDRGAEVVVTDVTDTDSLAAALSGTDGAYLLMPPATQVDDFIEHRREVVRTARAAIEKSNVPHVVYLSSIGAQQPEGTGVIRSAFIAEQELESVDADTTFLRPAYFIENWAAVLSTATSDGVLPTMWSPADQKIPQVATLDIGRVAAEALLDGPGGNAQRVELAGPEDLSAEDVAAILADLLGREIGVTVVPAQAQVEMFKAFASQSAAEAYYEMFRGMETGKVTMEGGDIPLVRGTTTAREVLGVLLNA